MYQLLFLARVNYIKIRNYCCHVCIIHRSTTRCTLHVSVQNDSLMMAEYFSRNM
jgi:hypothetical protein